MTSVRPSLCAFLIAFAFPALASAELHIVDSDALQLGLGAYVGTFSAYQRTPYETAGLLPKSAGTNAALLRLEWKAAFGDNVTADVQNRFFWTLSPAGASLGGLGLGATVPPKRSLDLQSEILNENGARLEHDLDRLALTIFSPVADITIGRQAVSWGNSTIFTLGDLWTQFSPFELDTSQKRGVDALRMLSYPGPVELELIVVDRGTLQDLSGGVRAGWTLGDADYYAAVAKNYRSVWGLMGFAFDAGSGRLHGELGLPLALELENEEPAGLRLPRATVGFDWFESSKFTAFLEYHFNGPGTQDPDKYLFDLQSPEVARGERYFLGRHYAGLGAAYLPFDDLLTLSLSAIGNLTDPSVLLSPSVGYALSQNVTATLGGFAGIGKYPDISFDPANPALTSFKVFSEYGLYGQVFFLQLAGYF